MASKKFWLRMLIMTLVFGMAVVGCDNGSTSSGGGSDAPPTSGRLTITGLEAYNGNYVYAEGGTENVFLLAGENINLLQETFTGSRISNGSVTLKVWQRLETDELVAYSGNNRNVEFGQLLIYSKATVSFSDIEIAYGRKEDVEKVNFSNGVGSCAIINLIPVVIVDIGSGIKARIEAYHYGLDSNNIEDSYIILRFTSRSVAIDESVYDDDYKQDFEVTVDGDIITFYRVSIGGDVRFYSSDINLITAKKEYNIQVKYTANPDRAIKIWIPKGNDDYWEPSGAYNILNSFDTGEKTIMADKW